MPFALIEKHTALVYDTPTLVDITMDAVPSVPTGASLASPSGSSRSTLVLSTRPTSRAPACARPGGSACCALRL